MALSITQLERSVERFVRNNRGDYADPQPTLADMKSHLGI